MAANAEASSSTLPPPPRATSILVIGMAGSGKSTFAGALAKHLGQAGAQESSANDAYLVNLDPAVASLNYEPNVDIRDTVDYKRVMEEYNLGPNGGILTSLNLFTTKFDQVLGILDARSNEVDQIILDTPGQIEIFTWSASGTIITDTLASSMPTCIAYVIDTPRTTAPATFMSNMLYACSIMYKTKLPFVLVFNKTDEQDHGFAMEWMEDFEAFQRDLQKGNATEKVDVTKRSQGRAVPDDTGGGGSYMNSLVNSMALVLDEFYNNIRAVGLSSVTGQGMDSFLSAVSEARQEYMDEYRPELEKMRALKKSKQEDRKKAELKRMMRDLRVGKSPGASRTGGDDGDDDEQGADGQDARINAALRSRVGGAGYDGDGVLLDPDDVEYETRGAAAGQAGQEPHGTVFGAGDDDFAPSSMADAARRRQADQAVRAVGSGAAGRQ